jgi:hypothetical protein
MSSRPLYRVVVACALVTLVLRAAIPAGFMPTAVTGGLLFEMCPSAVPAEILAAMSGAGHHHGGHESGDAGKHFDAGSCPIGQALSAATAIDELRLADVPPAATTLNARIPAALTSHDQPTRRSRDPPA